jgi:hypothetical protein
MKFPKSLHADGWSSHIDTTKSDKPSAAAKPMGAKPALRDEPLRMTPAQAAPRVEPHGFSAAAPAPFTASAGTGRTAAPSTAARSGINPWLLGAGVCAALIGLAVTMSRTLSPSEPSTPPAAVLSQATPSPEDAQLQAEPSSAGPVTPAPAVEPAQAPVAAPPPAAEPAVKAAPSKMAEAPAPSLPVVRGDPAHTPRTLAQAAPAPVRESALQPLAPVAPAAVTPPVQATPAPAPAPLAPPAAVPPATVPPATVPPVAQAEPQPPVVNPEDTNITVNVRTALAADATLAVVPIAVSTDHGVVKLEGQAPDASTRERATVVAAATNGVKAVDNRLTLPPVATVGAVTQGSGG